jgi:acetone carboxylase alpha subunit
VLVPDLHATDERRRHMRRQRLDRARPVAAWLADERHRVERSDFAPEVRRMYCSAMRLSHRFAEEFRSFWGLRSGHEVADGDVR